MHQDTNWLRLYSYVNNFTALVFSVHATQIVKRCFFFKKYYGKITLKNHTNLFLETFFYQYFINHACLVLHAREDGLTDPPECTLSIVCQNEVNGNGMQTRDDEWVLVKPLLTSLIIMSPPWRGGDEGK